MKKFISSIFALLSAVIMVKAQALQDINYNYLYDPDEAFSFQLKKVRTPEGWNILYELQLRDTSVSIDQYAVFWEKRTTLSDKEGELITAEQLGTPNWTGDKESKSGEIFLTSALAPPVLVAKVVSNVAKRAWLFYEILEPNYVKNTYLRSNEAPVLSTYVNLNKPVSIHGIAAGNSLVVSYFDHEFPAAAPAFSEAMSRVSRSMNVDSSFSVSPGQTFIPELPGLYLVQADTASTQGLAFRAEGDYPKLARLESLVDPLIYICTKQEFDKLKNSKGDKKVFDKTILSITGNADRARGFMRSYFQRVELANQYFTSYKEGWKSDRGMIFIIFGLPDEVFKFSDREVWKYEGPVLKTQFSFAKSSSLFDPDNFVLIRDKKFQQDWYEIIDLWRKARF